MDSIIKDSLTKSTTYSSYRKMVSDLLEEGKSTGSNQSEELLQYSLLNNKRMARLDKKIQLSEETIQKLKEVDTEQTWLLITEGWCGDAAHILPVMHKMSVANENIRLKVVLRDENLTLMNQFLTNGNKSIPKLVVLNAKDEVVSSWGPRPSNATEMVADYKKQHGTLDPEFKKNLQVWYNKDKGNNIQKDLVKFLEN